MDSGTAGNLLRVCHFLIISVYLKPCLKSVLIKFVA